MSLLGSAIRKSIQFGKTPEYPRNAPGGVQARQLLRLIRQAQYTVFGQQYDFESILFADNPIQMYKSTVPAVDYNTMYNNWWREAHLCDTPNLTWPGITPYYALSSGTSQAATKFIPVTKDMLRVMKRGSSRMFFDLSKYNLESDHFVRQILMVGSCTRVKAEGLHQTGDLSGIIGLHRPLWMSRYYRPDRDITDLPDWNERIEAITEQAPNWDLGSVVGNPAWVQLIFERIIERYKVKNIHEIWPNFSIYVHSGVFFEPYKPSFERLLGKPVSYIDSYLASEGFIAYQNRPDSNSMRLLLNTGIFYEFVPFTPENFDDNGDLLTPFPQSLALDEVKENEHYALLLSNTSGAWRYLLGDTIIFTDIERCEIRLTGRTKQFLSACGEHLSIDNLSAAIRIVEEELGVHIGEFCVAAVRESDQWAHQWWISVSDPSVDQAALVQRLDLALSAINDDYRIERDYALNDVRLKILPNHLFFDWLESKGKMNGQAKVPRVLKGAQLEDFTRFVQEKGF